MFHFRKPRRWCGLIPDKRGWFAVVTGGRKIGYVRRESAGRWIGCFSRNTEESQPPVVGSTRDTAAEALYWRVNARAEGTGEV
ncbi:hypothetical protein [Sphingomicrobium clamense]|uniref:HIRAN domain-containing protein n=1 Tax=Sphingomicrobium clamense TaxID=2851013 RepID=A0ABS6V7D5_9SPHN|nr:hypothetical protein [Sphingomicrobium sp. B8]MBW0145483.1 hypothetical protein [Sphingomicrobium sp. B8]